MSAGSWASVAAMMTLTTACAFMYYRIFRLRYSFDIAARSPLLFCLAGCCNLVVANAVLLHQALLLDGEGLPCYAVFWPSYFWFAFSCTPYCLRACRLVVVYNTNYRLKLARFVKSKALTKVWALSAIGIFVYAAAIFVNMRDRYARGNYGCFFFHEKLVLEIGVGLCTPLASFLVLKLNAVNDAYGIKPEVMIVLGWSLSAGGMHNRGYHSSHLSRDDHHTGQTCADGEPTCLRYARESGDLASLFGDYCKRCLCAESWEFMVEAVAYEEMSQLHEQHSAFIGIVDKYLRPTSSQEINIGSAMKASVTAFSNIEQFSKLDEAQRRGILGPPALEISRMLEQNLLNRFMETPEMQLRLEQQRREEAEMEQAEHMFKLLNTPPPRG